jgi:hypothetical protein
MKTKLFLTATLIGVATLSTRAGVDVGVTIVAPAPVVVIAPPTVIMVPDVYVWDGVENVGTVNGQYFYLGPGDVWLVCDPDRLTRFHGWEKGHADWQTHATRNDSYRKDARGNVHPIVNREPEKADTKSIRDDRSEKAGDKEAPTKSDRKDDKKSDKQ